VLQRLEKLNEAGAGIFVTINKTDGQGRSGKNMVAVRSLFVDLDGPPLAVVQEYKRTHLVVATSPGKYHCYWFVTGVEVEDFRGYQEALNERFGSDPSVKSPEHVMRLPGFYHRKDKPFLCRVYGKGHPDQRLYQGNEFEKRVRPIRVHNYDDDDGRVHLGEVQTMMRFVPTTSDDPKYGGKQRPYRIDLGMAVHYCTGGSEEGYAIWIKWLGRDGGKFKEAEAQRSWNGFHPRGEIGFATIVYLANQAVPDWRDQVDREHLQMIDDQMQDYNGSSLYEACGVATPQEQAEGAPPIKKKAPGLNEGDRAEPGEDDPEPEQVGAPFMLTNEMKRRLRDLGYSDEKIAQLTPQQAHEILAKDGGPETNPKPEPEPEPEPEPKPSPRTKLIVSSKTFIANFQPPDYLIDGLLQRRFIYSFTGLTSGGKTAVAIRLTAHVAFGLELPGRAVEQGKVLYLAGENPDDVRMRWIKQCEEMNLDANTDAVFWREGTLRLGNSNIWNCLMDDCRAAGPFSLVIVDTAAAYFTGNDENDNVQAGSYARLLRSFTKEVAGGPTVLVACHPPKNAPPENLLPRGGGAFLNEMDGNLTA
jgi:hypothetical protein